MRPFATAALAALLLSAGASAAWAAAPAPAAPAAPAEADWRTPDPADVLVIDTTKGRVFVELSAIAAPLAVERLRALTRTGFYDGRAFFRVIDGFMDQTGDPLDNGTGGSTQPNLPPEFTFRRASDTPMVVVEHSGGLESGFIGALPVISQTMDLGLLTADGKVKAYAPFCPGVGGMARAQDPGSANSQFFLMRGATASLNQNYTAWGRVIAGLDVVDAIKTGEPPTDPDKMLKVRLLADIPAAERPVVRVIDTRGAWFKAQVERVRAEKVIDFSVCDLDLPSQVIPTK